VNVGAENVKSYKCGGVCWAWRNNSPHMNIDQEYVLVTEVQLHGKPSINSLVFFFFTIGLDSSFIITQIPFNKFSVAPNDVRLYSLR